jgi:hypothetical protein
MREFGCVASDFFFLHLWTILAAHHRHTEMFGIFSDFFFFFSSYIGSQPWRRAVSGTRFVEASSSKQCVNIRVLCSFTGYPLTRTIGSRKKCVNITSPGSNFSVLVGIALCAESRVIIFSTPHLIRRKTKQQTNIICSHHGLEVREFACPNTTPKKKRKGEINIMLNFTGHTKKNLIHSYLEHWIKFCSSIIASCQLLQHVHLSMISTATMRTGHYEAFRFSLSCAFCSTIENGH